MLRHGAQRGRDLIRPAIGGLLGRASHRARKLPLHIANHILDPAAREAGAEELGRQIRNLMRLIEDQRVGRAQDVPEAVFFQSQVSEQEVMVDDHDVRFLRHATRRGDMTPGELATAHAEAVVPRRRHLRPQRMRVGKTGHLSEIA